MVPDNTHFHPEKRSCFLFKAQGVIALHIDAKASTPHEMTCGDSSAITEGLEVGQIKNVSALILIIFRI